MELTLEQARMMRKMSRATVAKELKVNETTIYRWETGKTMPDVVQFKKLCRLYDISADDLFVCSEG